MQIPRIDPKNAAGLADKIVGLGKEIVGTLAGNDRLTKAGQVQQDKGTERLKAIEAEVEAQTHKARAKSAEAAQKSAQNTKEKVNS
ncbi:hypothetical protein [Jatrophihabitans endophyticus]|uniref:hypothetical protein n=1 Tax=Jatrophihabitans endophyticus TaxID=1206085 RepID=UPI0019D83607|nr:hypothetical protein [Jatrophihabitans endophyticus]MBE7187055.1 CsbD family protein [Jatrophihabitans endophyticus]